jgi:hypothetical protein
MRTLLIAATAFVALTATALATRHSGPSAVTSKTTTMSLVAVEQACGGADLPPADGSPGDVTMCRGRLQDASTHAVVGRAAWYCPYTGAERAGDVCTAVAGLRRGDITLAGRLSHTSAKSTWAITGGTGAYATARGTATVHQLSETRTAVTLRLR